MNDGSELLTAHLSCFAYSSARAAIELMAVAVGHALRAGLPALFVPVVERDADELGGLLRNHEVQAAPASVYGAGLIAAAWNINSSEI